MVGHLKSCTECQCQKAGCKGANGIPEKQKKTIPSLPKKTQKRKRAEVESEEEEDDEDVIEVQNPRRWSANGRTTQRPAKLTPSS